VSQGERRFIETSVQISRRSFLTIIFTRNQWVEYRCNQFRFNDPLYRNKRYSSCNLLNARAHSSSCETAYSRCHVSLISNTEIYGWVEKISINGHSKMIDRTKKHSPINFLVIVTFSQMTVCSNSVVRNSN